MLAGSSAPSRVIVQKGEGQSMLKTCTLPMVCVLDRLHPDWFSCGVLSIFVGCECSVVIGYITGHPSHLSLLVSLSQPVIGPFVLSVSFSDFLR